MASPPFLYNDFKGGLNTLDSAFLLQDNEARDLSNVQGTTAGAIVKRNGLVTFASPANRLHSLVSCESTASLFLVGAGNGLLYKIDTGGVVTQIGSGFNASARWEFVEGPVSSAQGPLFGMNGTDTPQQWSGTGSAANWTASDAGGAVPNGKYVVVHQNQAFVAGVAAQPSRVYWSGLANFTQWNPANLNGSGFMDFDPGDGQAITGLGHVGPYLLVAKARKLFVLIDPAAATSRRIADNIGVASHRSIASGPEGTYFLAEDRGVYLTNGSKVTPISDRIQPTIDAASSRTTAAGGYFNGHYYLSIPSAGSNNSTLDYDSVLQSWWKHSFGSNQMVVWHPTGTARLYSAKGTSAVVDQCFVPNTTTDNGSAFQWVWRGPWQSPTFYRRRRFPTPYFRKRLRQFRAEGAGQVDFSIAKDFAGSETLWGSDIFDYAASSKNFAGSGTFAGTGIFGGAGSITHYRAFSLGVSNAFSVVFSGTNTAPASVNEYVLMILDRRDSTN